MAEETWLVRVYLAITQEHQEVLLRRLQEWEHIRGATVFQGRAGFGDHGRTVGEKIPTVIEFFETKDNARRVIAHLEDSIEPEHIVYWPVQLHRREPREP